jgi:phage terminase large subunit
MQTTCLFQWNSEPEKYCNVDPNRKVICVNQGGTSSGKTYAIMQVLFVLAIKHSRWIITVVGQDYPNLAKGSIRDSQKIVGDTPFIQASLVGDFNKGNKSYVFKNGSIIEFTSYQNSQDAKNGKRQVLFVNEANGIHYDIYHELEMRTDQKVFIDYNPNQEFWAHEKVIGTQNVALFISNYEHNAFVSPNIVESILKLKKTDPQLWRVYGLGQTGKIEGAVFDYRIVDQFPEHLDKRAFGMDFGFTNDPTTLVLCGISDGQIYGKELLYQTGMTNRDINAMFKELGVQKSDQIFADSADPKTIHELRTYGWNIIPAEKGADSISFSINLIKQYGKLNISRESLNWIKEAQNYKWRENRNGRKLAVPVDAFNHAWDACRYWALGMIKKGNKKGILAYG